MTEPLLWDIETTATKLGVSVKLVRRMVRDGQIPYLRVASLLKFQPDALRAWIAKRESEAGT